MKKPHTIYFKVGTMKQYLCWLFGHSFVRHHTPDMGIVGWKCVHCGKWTEEGDE